MAIIQPTSNGFQPKSDVAHFEKGGTEEEMKNGQLDLKNRRIERTLENETGDRREGGSTSLPICEWGQDV